MSSSHLTEDPNDPRLGHGIDTEPVPQHDVYLVLSKEEREKEFVRPFRNSYIHVGVDGTEEHPTGEGCRVKTCMGQALSETYARDPKFYGATYCVGCEKHLPVNEFIWADDEERVGS